MTLRDSRLINCLCIYLISLLWVDMFVFQVGVASVNQLEVVIGPSMHTSQI